MKIICPSYSLEAFGCHKIIYTAQHFVSDGDNEDLVTKGALSLGALILVVSKGH